MKSHIEARKAYLARYHLPQVDLENTESGGMRSYIYTDHLNIVPATEEDFEEHFTYLYSNPAIMKTMRDGLIKDKEWLWSRISDWKIRWENNIPFAGMKIVDNSTSEFIGHIGLYPSNTRNSVDLAYMIREDKQKEGYAYEAAGAIVLEYCPLLKSKNYKINLQGEELNNIVAISRIANVPSNNIIMKLGFEKKYEFTEFDATRYYYEKEVFAPNVYEDGIESSLLGDNQDINDNCCSCCLIQ